MKLPVRIKNEWLEALRSDNYAKGTQWLCKDNKFCCLGVLCEVLRIPWSIENMRDGAFRRYGHTFNVLPNKALVLLGAKSDKIPNQFAVNETDLIRLNDTTETFDEVIKYIEENL